jgi:L-seryl-tRNA(Ser) seleniumtransferase
VPEATSHDPEAVREKLRSLPSVEQVVALLGDLAGRFPRPLIVEEARRVLEGLRQEVFAGGSPDPASAPARVRSALEALAAPSLRRVINATGVVLHTNLGRAPLPPFVPLAGYSNLEYDLAAGRRGRRDVHAAGLMERCFGAPGIVVNNNAAAVFLALHELACGFEVIVSRGELIEIGDGFRIPDIMARSGAILREVGTTNRTRIEDYREAITERTRLLLRVHRSNFEIRGFTGRPELKELVALGRERGIPVYEDLGSGCPVELAAYGLQEPVVSEALAEGADLVSFSGDKLLGGPQAGLLVGRPELIARLRRNPLFRALRVDKLIYQALETTLRHLVLGRVEEIPALRMIAEPAERVRERAEAVCGRLAGVSASVVPGQSVVGGGSTPEQPLPTWLIAIPTSDAAGLERRLRLGQPPVIARVEKEQVLLDLRTVFPEEEEELARAVAEAVAGPGSRVAP